MDEKMDTTCIVIISHIAINPFFHNMTKYIEAESAIYGLRQSPRAWFEKFSRVVIAVVFNNVILITL